MNELFLVRIRMSWRMEKGFVEQQDEEVQDEDDKEESMRNTGVSIGWFPNINFDGVDTQPLFNDDFFHSEPENRVTRMSQNPALDCKLQKTQ